MEDLFLEHEPKHPTQVTQPNQLTAADRRKSITPQEAIETLMRSSGNLRLAAERLSRAHDLFNPDDALKPQDVQYLCAEDMPLLQRNIKASVTIEVYSTIDIALSAAVAAIPALEPSQAVNALTRLIGLLHNLTDDKHATLDVNVNEQRYNMLNPEMKNILATLEIMERTEREVNARVIPHQSNELPPDYTPPDGD